MSFPPKSFSLKLLGGCALAAPEGLVTGRAVQRRRLAALAVVAAAGPSGVSRDRLIGLLWPESDTQQARHLLTDTLYVLRSALGDDAFVMSGDNVALNSTVVTCDVVDFNAALERNDRQTAAAVYGGPFLDGFHIAGAPEFERWVDAERDRLSLAHAAALESLAIEAETAGDPVAAALRWKTLAAARPYDSRIALRTASTLDAAGDRAGALRHLHTHRLLLQSELEVDVDADVALLEARLKQSSPPVPRAGQGATIEPAQTVAAAPAVAVTARALRRHLTRGRAFVLGLLVTLTVAWATLAGVRSHPVAKAAEATIAILPFSLTGPSQFDYLTAGMADLLGRKLDDIDQLRTVSLAPLMRALRSMPHQDADLATGRAVAQRLGAGMFVLGSVAVVGQRIELSASLYSATGRSLAVAQVRGSEPELFELVDELARLLLADRYRGPAQHMRRLAATTSSSLPALKAYLEGEQHLRAGRVQPAIDAFQYALQLDTSFALAAIQLATAIANYPETRTAPSFRDVIAQAQRHADRLPAVDRELLQGMIAGAAGHCFRAVQLVRGVLERRPHEVEAWYRLGDGLTHCNPARGAALSEGRYPLWRALQLDSTHWSSWLHIAMIARMERNAQEYRAAMQRVVGGDTSGYFALKASLSSAVLEQDSAAVERALLALQSAPSALWGSAIDLLQLQEYATAKRMVEAVVRGAPSATAQIGGRYLLARIALASGQWEAARAQLDTADAASRDDTGWRWGQLAIWADIPIATSELLSIRSVVERAPPVTLSDARRFRDLAERQFQLGMLDLRLADSTTVQQRLAEMERLESEARETSDYDAIGPFTPAYFHTGLSAARALALHRHEEAIRLLETPVMEAKMVVLRYLYAQALERAGRLEEALRWYGTFDADLTTVELVPFPTDALSHLHRAMIHERLGHVEAARGHYRRFTQLWQNADPALQPRVAHARSRIAAK